MVACPHPIKGAAQSSMLGPVKPDTMGSLAWLLATGLGSGLAPVAPATVGSLVALVVYFFIPVSEESLGLFLLIGLGFITGVWATGRLSDSSEPDPGRAVWDEFVGMWATCLLLPKTLPWMAAAFVSFRVLDVLKPWPIRRLELLPGGWGIMADDLAAGLLGAVLLNGLRLAFF